MNDMINELNPYMMTCKNISKFTRNVEIINHPPPIKKFKPEKVCSSIFIPYQNDKLFWIYYYIVYGYDKYNFIGSNSYSVEMEEKYKLIQVLKENKHLFKEFKLKKIEDSVNELLSNSEISFKTFELLCISNKINFIIINENMFHKINFNENDDVYIIHVVNNIYGCEKINSEDLTKYEINRYFIENYDKPIRSIGNFKIDDLIKIANILDISLYDENNKKLNKEKLYSHIYFKIMTFFKK